MICIPYLEKKNWVFILVSCIILFVGLVFVIFGAVNYEKEETKTISNSASYGVVLDAGGSSTKMYMYEYLKNKNEVNEIQKKTCEKQGMSNYKVEDYPKLESAILDCLKTAASRLPSRVPLFMGATAGMRMLKVKNETRHNELWNFVRGFLSKSNFKVELSETITGDHEAQWAFVAANLLKETFEHNKQSVGVTEMGSSSLQLAFVPKTVVKGGKDIEMFNFNGKSYSVYGHSYLCFGKKEIERRFLAKLVKEKGYSAMVDNPCYFSGYEQNYTSDFLWAAPCSSGPYAKDKLGEEFTGPAGQTYTIKGTGNGTQCFDLIDQLINVKCSTSTSCGINDVFQPPVNGKYLGLAAFAYASDFMGVAPNVGMEEYEVKWKKTCAAPWDDVKSRDIPGSAPKYRTARCFDITYSYFLLTKAFKFDENTWKMEFTNKVNGETAAWSLGLLYTNKDKLYERVLSQQVLVITRNTSYMVLIIFGVIILLIGLVLLVLSCMARHRAYNMPPEQATIMDVA